MDWSSSDNEDIIIAAIVRGLQIQEKKDANIIELIMQIKSHINIVS
jgi:hypothetical protein